MYRRIVKERAKGDDLQHFKTGKGGLIGIEFLVQYLQMKHQVRETNTLRAIGKLTGVLDPDEAVDLGATYGFLRRIESVLRRVSKQLDLSTPVQRRRSSCTGDPDGICQSGRISRPVPRAPPPVETIIEKHFD